MAGRSMSAPISMGWRPWWPVSSSVLHPSISTSVPSTVGSVMFSSAAWLTTLRIDSTTSTSSSTTFWPRRGETAVARTQATPATPTRVWRLSMSMMPPDFFGRVDEIKRLVAYGQ